MTTSRPLRLVLPWIVAGLCAGCGAAEQVDDGPAPAAPRAITRTNTCPQFRWWLLLPKSLPLGQTTEIIVDVSDPDTPLTKLAFDWQAEAGVFSDPDLSSTAYTCERVGRQALTFFARDPQDCTSVLQLDVQCTEPP